MSCIATFSDSLEEWTNPYEMSSPKILLVWMAYEYAPRTIPIYSSCITYTVCSVHCAGNRMKTISIFPDKWCRRKFHFRKFICRWRNDPIENGMVKHSWVYWLTHVKWSIVCLVRWHHLPDAVDIIIFGGHSHGINTASSNWIRLWIKKMRKIFFSAS